MQADTDDSAALIARIDTLCAELCATVHGAEWDAAGKLLSLRHRLIETLYAKPPETADQLDALRALGKRVVSCDRELARAASTARDATEEQLRALHTGRRAAAAYADNT